MLIEDELFNEDNPPPGAFAPEWRDCVVRRTTFDAIALEGLSFDGVMESCTLTSSDFYWGFFNCALIAKTRFEACVFPATSFRGCTLVECEFIECRFELCNMGGDCTIDDCVIAASRFVGCTWTTKGPDCKPDVTKTRWLGCTQERCKGFEGIF
ncbi:MAG: pentapeptide repeat-containing protein [Hyphomicrobium sp.]|uniref:pentapeptide repeat-containing protein n=1 Tax=Hyphomicrobium sp. TaxID=82 RepID=UPI003D0E868A